MIWNLAEPCLLANHTKKVPEGTLSAFGCGMPPLSRTEAGTAHKEEAAALAAAAEKEKAADQQRKAALKEQVVADRVKVKQAQVRWVGLVREDSMTVGLRFAERRGERMSLARQIRGGGGGDGFWRRWEEDF